MKYKILKIALPITYFRKEKKIVFIIEKKGWFGWKRLIKRNGSGRLALINFYVWTYSNKDYSFTFEDKKKAMLWLRTILGLLKGEVCGEVKISF